MTKLDLKNHGCPGCLLALTNTLGPTKYGRHIAEDIFELISLNEKCCLLIPMSLNCAPHGQLDTKSAVVQTMTGDVGSVSGGCDTPSLIDWARTQNDPCDMPYSVSMSQPTFAASFIHLRTL